MFVLSYFSELLCALLAQLDRVTGYEPVGQGFESLTARHIGASDISLLRFFIRSLHAFSHDGALTAADILRTAWVQLRNFANISLYPCDKGAKRTLCAFFNLFRKEAAPAEVSGASGQPEFTPVTTVVDRSLRRVQDVDGAIVEKAV